MRGWVMLTVVCCAVVAFTAPRSVVAQQAAATECLADPLGPVPEWDMVVLGDARWKANENQGRAVVGRDASLESIGVATRLATDRNRLDFAVGHDLKSTNNVINNGGATYGNTLNVPGDTQYYTKAAPRSTSTRCSARWRSAPGSGRRRSP